MKNIQSIEEKSALERDAQKINDSTQKPSPSGISVQAPMSKDTEQPDIKDVKYPTIKSILLALARAKLAEKDHPQGDSYDVMSAYREIENYMASALQTRDQAWEERVGEVKKEVKNQLAEELYSGEYPIDRQKKIDRNFEWAYRAMVDDKEDVGETLSLLRTNILSIVDNDKFAAADLPMKATPTSNTKGK